MLVKGVVKCASGATQQKMKGCGVTLRSCCKIHSNLVVVESTVSTTLSIVQAVVVRAPFQACTEHVQLAMVSIEGDASSSGILS